MKTWVITSSLTSRLPTSASSSRSAITPSTVPPAESAARAVTPISPTSPPP